MLKKIKENLESEGLEVLALNNSQALVIKDNERRVVG